MNPTLCQTPPGRLVRIVRRVLDRAVDIAGVGRRRCTVCDANVRRFVPLFECDPGLYHELVAAGFDLTLFQTAETLNLNAFACPKCGASDRERLYAVYLNGLLREHGADRPLRLLDIAPAEALGNRLRSRDDIEYRSADLYAPGVDDRVDLTDMSIYPDGSWDIIICSHVLEHIPDDSAAMREIARVLAPHGVAIVMVPLSDAEPDTRETDSADPVERTRVCGQSDHVRWYGRADWLGRLEAARLAIHVWTPAELGITAPEEVGVMPGSRLYTARSAGSATR